MIESARSSDVTDLTKYRATQHSKKRPGQPIGTALPDKLLDEISYHLLMAARAISKHTPK